MSDPVVSAISLFLTVLILSAAPFRILYRLRLLSFYLLLPPACLLVFCLTAEGGPAAVLTIKALFPAVLGLGTGILFGIMRLRERGIQLSRCNFSPQAFYNDRETSDDSQEE